MEAYMFCFGVLIVMLEAKNNLCKDNVSRSAVATAVATAIDSTQHIAHSTREHGNEQHRGRPRHSSLATNRPSPTRLPFEVDEHS